MVASVYNVQFSLRSLNDANYTIDYIILFTLSYSAYLQEILGPQKHTNAEGPTMRASVVYVTHGRDA